MNSSTNQMWPADANGNWLGTNSPQNTWDAENRLISSGTYDGSGNLIYYSYHPWGKRVMQFAFGGDAGMSTCLIYFYGVNGKRLGTYGCSQSGNVFTAGTQSIYQYFGKKLIATGNGAGEPLPVFTDRLGSVRQSGNGQMAYYPYGEERTSTPNGTDKFGTYFRDGYGQDYAEQRYFTSVYGRFWSPDPGGVKTADPKSPACWIRGCLGAGSMCSRSRMGRVPDHKSVSVVRNSMRRHPSLPRSTKLGSPSPRRARNVYTTSAEETRLPSRMSKAS